MTAVGRERALEFVRHLLIESRLLHLIPQQEALFLGSFALPLAEVGMLCLASVDQIGSHRR